MISLDNISIYQYGKPNAIVTIPKSSPYGWDFLPSPCDVVFLAQVPCHPVPYSWAFAKLHRCCCLQVGFGRITRLRDSSNDFHVFVGGMKWLIDRIRLNRFHWTMFFWGLFAKYKILYSLLENNQHWYEQHRDGSPGGSQINMGDPKGTIQSENPLVIWWPWSPKSSHPEDWKSAGLRWIILCFLNEEIDIIDHQWWSYDESCWLIKSLFSIWITFILCIYTHIYNYIYIYGIYYIVIYLLCNVYTKIFWASIRNQVRQLDAWWTSNLARSMSSTWNPEMEGYGNLMELNGIYIYAQIIARTAEATRQVAGISEVSP